jgi:hypothetical protein
MNFILQNYTSSKDASSVYNQADTAYDSRVQELLNERETGVANNEARSNVTNGYVDLTTTETQGQIFDLYREKTNGNNRFSKESIVNIHTDSNLSQIYFSTENIDLIQDMVRYQVYEQSNRQHVIARQSDVELKIIMRSIYLQYGKNLPDDIKGQVAELNEMVIQECIPSIMTAVEQYLGYRIHITQGPIPMARSVNVSNAGSKTLQPNHFF